MNNSGRRTSASDGNGSLGGLLAGFAALVGASGLVFLVAALAMSVAHAILHHTPFAAAVDLAML